MFSTAALEAIKQKFVEGKLFSSIPNQRSQLKVSLDTDIFIQARFQNLYCLGTVFLENMPPTKPRKGKAWDPGNGRYNIRERWRKLLDHWEGWSYVDRPAVSQESKPKCWRTEAPGGRSLERNRARHIAGLKIMQSHLRPHRHLVWPHRNSHREDVKLCRKATSFSLVQRDLDKAITKQNEIY